MIGMVGLEERRGEGGRANTEKGERGWNGLGGVSEEHWFNYDFRHVLLFKNLYA